MKQPLCVRALNCSTCDMDFLLHDENLLLLGLSPDVALAYMM